ncbi:MAG: hypothetical protein ACOH1Y_16885, partial [Propionicimonas sp.]
MTAVREHGFLDDPGVAGRAEGIRRTGWTAEDWDEVYDMGAAFPAPHQRYLQRWLLHPPEQFVVLVTPQQVRGAFAVYGPMVTGALDAFAAGASDRFVAAFAAHQEHLVDLTRSTWLTLVSMGLSEPAATGWALTLGPGSSLAASMARLARWVGSFGETAYLWVLAGFTLEEATKLRAAREAP